MGCATARCAHDGGRSDTGAPLTSGASPASSEPTVSSTVGGEPTAPSGSGQGAPGPSPSLRTAFTDLVGVRHPLVQTGMGWVAGPRLVSATANAGALGILASATMTAPELRAAIREVASRTGAPFGVNLRADAGDAAERVGVIIEEGVRVASFALAPSRELITRLKEAGVVVMPSIGARRRPRRWPRGAPTRSSCRVVRAVGTPVRWPRVCCCRRSWTRSVFP